MTRDRLASAGRVRDHHSFASMVLVTASLVAITLVTTWPLCSLGGSRIAGDAMDPSQTVWGFWWWRHYAEFSGTPFVGSLLWWPNGVSLWFQSWDLPSTFVAVASSRWMSEVSVYNVLIFASFPLSGLTLYLLCLELWSSRVAAWCSCCLYTFSTYHFAHAQMQLHLSSMQWSPLFFLGLIRFARYGGYPNALLAGASLAFASLTSIYHLVFCAIGTLVMAMAGFPERPRPQVSPQRVAPLAAGVGIFAIMAGWLLVGMAHSYASETYVRVHDPDVFSADIQSFFLPNAVSTWSEKWQAWRSWTGNSWESSSYLGYVVLALAASSWWLDTASRPFLWLSIVGVVLALGPHPHIGGTVYRDLTLPQAWLEQALPALSFSGLPVRFSWLATFGLAVASGAPLARLCRTGVIGCGIALALTALSLAETWPRHFIATKWTTPRIFLDWAADNGRWAVLDGTELGHGLWNQMQHHHPMVAGYATRFPRRLLDSLDQESTLKALLPAPFSGPLHVAPDAGRASLRRAGVRYVIADASRTGNATALKLVERYRSDGIVIYEVP